MFQTQPEGGRGRGQKLGVAGAERGVRRLVYSRLAARVEYRATRGPPSRRPSKRVGVLLTEFPNSFRSDLLRDFCWTYRCEHERHIYEKCQYMDYKKRVKAAEDAK